MMNQCFEAETTRGKGEIWKFWNVLGLRVGRVCLRSLILNRGVYVSAKTRSQRPLLWEGRGRVGGREGGEREKKKNKTSPLPSPILAYNSWAIL